MVTDSTAPGWMDSAFDHSKNPLMMKTLKSLHTRRFETEASDGLNLSQSNRWTDKSECGLCYQSFTPTDEVFNCRKMHIFHTICYEERFMDESDAEDSTFQMRNLCPTCNSPMNISEE